MPLELDLEIDNRSGVELDASVYEKVEEYIIITLQQENVLVPCEISFSLVIPEEIQELNAEYRNIDKETDVLSFPMLEFPEDEDMLTYETGIPVMLGDIVISTTRAAEQAEAYGHSLEREICYLSVHSVLHLLGCAALLTCLLHPALEKLPPLAGVTGSAVLFALLNQLPQGWLGFEGTHLAALPAAWYKPNLFWLGLPDLTVFSSSDYFPLLPWVFLYWVGYFFARWFRARCTAQPGLPPKALRPLCAVGSRTLLIYMLHQPVIYGALLGLHALGLA